MRDSVGVFYNLYWGVAFVAGAGAIGVTVSALARANVNFLRRLLSLELAFLFTMASAFMTELGRGGPEIYNEVTRIGGLIGVSLLVITLPRFVNGRPPLLLIPKIDIGFTVVGAGLLVHYLASTVWHFARHHSQGIPYFDGHRVFPVFVTFFALAAAHIYLAIAFIVARPGGDLGRREKRVLSAFGIASFVFVPAMLVFDNLRWMFPTLWAIYPTERLFVLPLFYTYLGVTIILAIRASRRQRVSSRLGAEIGLTPRESEVADLLLDGLTYQNIADRLYVSLSTVQSHIASIYGKAGVNTKIQLSNLLRRIR